MSYLQSLILLHDLRKQHQQAKLNGNLNQARALWERINSLEDTLTDNPQVTSPCICWNCNGIGRNVWYVGMMRNAVICRRCAGKGFITVRCLNCGHESQVPAEFPHNGVCAVCEQVYPTAASLIIAYLDKAITPDMYRLRAQQYGTLVILPDMNERIRELLPKRESHS